MVLQKPQEYMKNEYDRQHKIILEKRKTIENVIDENPEFNTPSMKINNIQK